MVCQNHKGIHVRSFADGLQVFHSLFCYGLLLIFLMDFYVNLSSNQPASP